MEADGGPPVDNEQADQTVVRVRGGDVAAYGALVDAFQAKIAAFFVGRCPPGCEVEDLVQEVFVTAYWSLEHYTAEGRFSAWLHGVARNVLRDAWKKSRRRIQLSSIDEKVLEAALMLPAREMDREIEALERCLEGLSGNLRRLLSAVHVEGQRIGELAREVGKTATALRMMLHRVRVRLRECVRRQLISETA